MSQIEWVEIRKNEAQMRNSKRKKKKKKKK